jgi:hypothetical protein
MVPKDYRIVCFGADAAEVITEVASAPRVCKWKNWPVRHRLNLRTYLCNHSFEVQTVPTIDAEKPNDSNCTTIGSQQKLPVGWRKGNSNARFERKDCVMCNWRSPVRYPHVRPLDSKFRRLAWSSRYSDLNARVNHLGHLYPYDGHASPVEDLGCYAIISRRRFT